MNITIFSRKLDLHGGGSNFSLDLVARGFVDRGHEVTVVTLNFGAPNKVPEDVPYTVEERSIKPVDLLRKNKIIRIFSDYERNSDVYHTFSPLTSVYGGVYRSNGGNVPVVGRLNGYGAICSNPSLMDGKCHTTCGFIDRVNHSDTSTAHTAARIPYFLLQSFSYLDWMNELDRYYALSPAAKSIYSESGLNEDIIDVIPNFYEPEFVTSKPHQHNLKATELVYAGRLTYGKGVDLLISALTSLPRDVSLRIIGKGPQRPNLEDLVTEYSLEEQVEFSGYVDHDLLYDYLVKSDIFIHPGRWPEPFGRSILEAWQSGCAVIASNIGAPPWIIGDAGLTFEANDPVSLFEQINIYLSDGDCLEEMQTKGKKRLHDFSPQNIFDELEQSFLKLESH